ncbi:hypothetical protein CU311_06895 [Prochlorococcus marinus str. MU1402]|uniref:hypothetical protein n=1 Tax=Prochlorococcus marinus TaxID=1219 RepID=UPI001ADB36F7|nr:hypothetical protein [Prochlorococcus marinus]MBO8232406.1 hypothetical protein [Prochlorococcus marinus XMU1402]MBW3057134.1 hypothetical protein [Prochlorococcus marinus str. MU1402]
MEQITMYLEYLITAISLIPIYIFLLKGLNLKLSTALYIYFYRSIFSLFYIFYASNDFADANTYIRGNAIDSEVIGSGFVLRIVDFSGKYLGIKGYALYSLFGLLGALGCCYLYCAIKKCDLRGLNKIGITSALFCFLPSITFWTLSPGKDSINFLIINYALYSFIQLDDNSLKINFKILLSSIILLLIRPHVGASLILAYIVFYFFQIKKKKDIYIRFTLLFIITLTFWILVPFIQKFASIENMNILDSISILQERFVNTSSKEENINYILRVIFFLFTPLPAINFSPLYLADYVNTLFICFYLFNIIKDPKSFKNISNNPFFLFSIILLFLLPLIVYNPGIAARQKWIVLPTLVVSLKRNRYLSYKRIRESLRSNCD